MSNRQERNTRSNGRHDSAPGGDAPRSSAAISSDGEEPAERDLRRTRSQRRDHDPHTSPRQAAQGDNDKDADEDVTRCVCGHAEYPGPPFPNDKGPNDGAFFIQCEKCNVWQHAGCIGFFELEACPRHYYCDQCRPDLHKIVLSKQGTSYSQYGRAHAAGGPPSAISRTSTKETDSRSSKERDMKASAATANSLATAKRRATMNSRAAYDDEEVLRIIEESKRNGVAESTSGSRKSKRTREDSEESDHEQKRRKTRSESTSTPDNDEVAVEANSEDEEAKARSRSGQPLRRTKPLPSAQSEKERRREKERELERLDAAARRKGRSERRRVDTDAEPLEESVRAQSPGRSGGPKLARPQSNGKMAPIGPSSTPSTKKASKPNTKKRAGRNQYTRERDALADARASEARPPSSRDGEEGHAFGDGLAAVLPNGSKPAKAKVMNPLRTSMNDMRKRAAGILEFISRTQIEMAVDKPPSEESTPVPPPAQPQPQNSGRNGNKAGVNGNSKLSNEIRSDSNVGAEKASQAGTEKHEAAPSASEEDTPRSAMEEGEFKGLNTVQMMDVLSREIHRWEQTHGKYGTSA